MGKIYCEAEEGREEQRKNQEEAHRKEVEETLVKDMLCSEFFYNEIIDYLYKNASFFTGNNYPFCDDGKKWLNEVLAITAVDHISSYDDISSYDEMSEYSAAVLIYPYRAEVAIVHYYSHRIIESKPFTFYSTLSEDQQMALALALKSRFDWIYMGKTNFDGKSCYYVDTGNTGANI